MSLLLGGGVLSGCSDDPAPTDSGVVDVPVDVVGDTGSDAVTDTGSGSDAVTDTGRDSSGDTGTAQDTGSDVTSDVTSDTGSDAGSDVGSDVTADVSTDSGLAAQCVASGGTVSTALCCSATGDFPNLCTTGPCGCAPASSHTVMTCECPSGQCFNGTACAPR